MNYKRILTVQDISCFGQCSLTVALPILSAAGHETVILPSAVLSTHTAGFNGFTFCDLTDEIPKITKHWISQNIKFDAIYTGYLGSTTQIDYVKEMFKTLGKNDDFLKVVDPAMADNGKLYTGFDNEFVKEMKTLAFTADIILPNITEACLLTDTEYKEKYDESYIDNLINKLFSSGAKLIVLTGVSYDDDTTGVLVAEKSNKQYYRHRKNPKGSHGTGDIYASAFVGAYMRGKTAIDSAKIAADYTLSCIENTVGDDAHSYGVKFEPCLPKYIDMLNK
ncbi:MAG: pyridoxamine kinase [Clostridia bacterium]|nr:pyridoxamine kinase [Clostridia bacterium]